MDNGNAPVIRVVRKKRSDSGHHGGAWKVAYADFVTAMMAFFLVMWIIGLNKPVREAIAAYFRDPSGFMKDTKGGKSPLSSNDDNKTGKTAPILPQDGGKGPTEQMKAQFKQVEDAILKQLSHSPEFDDLKDSVQVHMTDEGLRVELIEKKSSLFFDSGKAQLKPRTVRLLTLIAHELSTLKNPVVVEGHTDSHPLNGANGYTNWELSADRANSARRAMEANGLRQGQVIAVRGYADRKLLKPEDPYHFSNRRVSILVPYDDNIKHQ
ncbi:MAG TPA: flagellar motor protein MotB [Chthonomonadaceae bacterium]|nr:flagellar motor protein MotB [Chthonomonadaceae bacterium]